MKYKEGEELRVKINAFKKAFGDVPWVIDHIRTQANNYPSLYICYRKDDKRKMFYHFLESQVEKYKC